ncbi:response regulator transcription factor [Kitasatospora sp. NPDC093558]|uniref:response regulator transcription factor n=1 Tax=Kitasatospora sp. NPDC093558 TaxID=3155201 RepID=UPI00344848DA
MSVVLVDDEALLRSGLAAILNSAADIEVVGSCAGSEALAVVTERQPDVVLLDVRMPDVDGLTVLRELVRLPQPPQVSMLTAFDADQYLAEALGAGAVGFLLKDMSPEELIRAVRALATGSGCLSAPMVRRLSRQEVAGPDLPADTTPADTALAELSERERNILALLGSGLSNVEIGRKLLLGTATVKDHVRSVLAKLRVSNRVQAAVLAERSGLLGPPRP